jgi:hypothetical protein
LAAADVMEEMNIKPKHMKHMKTHIRLRLIITILLFVFCANSCSLSYRYKYGILMDYSLKSRKKQLIEYVDILKILQGYKNHKVPLKEAYHNINCYCNHPIVKDSIISIFKIVDIEEKPTYNYQIQGKKIREVKIYQIDLLCITDTNMSLYSVITIDSGVENYPKIEVGEIYNLLLISYFDRDIEKMIDDDGTVIYDVKDTRQGINILVNNVWITELYLHHNLYITPNLHGLYYISNH